MHRVLGIAGAMAMVLTPAVARAADWWWVSGELGSDEAYFVDTDSIRPANGQISFQLLHISRDDRHATPVKQTVDCVGEPESGSREAVRSFVCASDDQRMSLGAMLGPISPQATADIIFESKPTRMAEHDYR